MKVVLIGLGIIAAFLGAYLLFGRRAEASGNFGVDPPVVPNVGNSKVANAESKSFTTQCEEYRNAATDASQYTNDTRAKLQGYAARGVNKINCMAAGLIYEGAKWVWKGGDTVWYGGIRDFAPSGYVSCGKNLPGQKCLESSMARVPGGLKAEEVNEETQRVSNSKKYRAPTKGAKALR